MQKCRQLQLAKEDGQLTIGYLSLVIGYRAVKCGLAALRWSLRAVGDHWSID